MKKAPYYPTCSKCGEALDLVRSHKCKRRTARAGHSLVRSSKLVAELEAAQTQLEDAWAALCKQDWGAATQNVFAVRASVTKLVESVRCATLSGGVC